MSKQPNTLTDLQFDLLRQVPEGYKDVNPTGVYVMKDPRLPQFEFHWHPGVQKVYCLYLRGYYKEGTWVKSGNQRDCTGEKIAEHVATHAIAFSFVQTFCRGYILALSQKARETTNYGGLVPERILLYSPLPTEGK
jgi:hypothetical protein